MISYGICLSLSGMIISSLGMIISRFIHVAENGIISLFLWLSSSPLYYYRKRCATSFSIHLSVYIYVVSMSWLL